MKKGLTRKEKARRMDEDAAAAEAVAQEIIKEAEQEAARLARITALVKSRRKHAKEQAVAVPWAQHALSGEVGILLLVLELLGTSAKDRAIASTVCKAWKEACASLQSKVYYFGDFDVCALGSVDEVATSRNGGVVVTSFSGNDNKMCGFDVYNTSSPKVVASMRRRGGSNENGIRLLAVSRDGALFVALEKSFKTRKVAGTVTTIYRTSDATVVARLEDSGSVIECDFGPDFAAISYYSSSLFRGPRVRLFDSTTWALRQRLKRANGATGEERGTMSVSPCGGKIAYLLNSSDEEGGRRRFLQIWETAQGAELFRVTHAVISDRRGTDVTWSPDSTRLLVASNFESYSKNVCYMFDASNGTALMVLRLPIRGRCFKVSWVDGLISANAVFSSARIYETIVCIFADLADGDVATVYGNLPSAKRVGSVRLQVSNDTHVILASVGLSPDGMALFVPFYGHKCVQGHQQFDVSRLLAEYRMVDGPAACDRILSTDINSAIDDDDLYVAKIDDSDVTNRERSDDSEEEVEGKPTAAVVDFDFDFQGV